MNAIFKIKKIVKLMTPPVVLEMAGKLRAGIRPNSKYYFNGIYKDFASVKLPTGDGFAVKRGVEWAVEKARKQMERTPDWRATGSISPGDHFLAMLLNMLMSEGSTEVWDVGGGVGNTFLSLKPYLYKNNFRWRIIELPSVSEAASRFLKDGPEVLVDTSFNSETVQVSGKIVTVLRTAIQYFPDPESWLRSLSFQSDYMALIRLPSGDNPDFWTTQNFMGTWHPFRFFNLNRIVSFLEDLGFDLIARCGETEFFDMNNFPLDHRVGQTVSLFFKKRHTEGTIK